MECFIIYKHMQSPEIKRKQSASQHIPAHPKYNFPQIPLKNTILLIGPHAFDFSGGLQSFLLIRELIRERLPQPVNTPELMEPIEPTEGGEDLQGGGVWERLKLEVSEISEFLYPKEFLKRELNYPLGFSHSFWERRLNCCGFHKDL